MAEAEAGKLMMSEADRLYADGGEGDGGRMLMAEAEVGKVMAAKAERGMLMAEAGRVMVDNRPYADGGGGGGEGDGGRSAVC